MISTNRAVAPVAARSENVPVLPDAPLVKPAAFNGDLVFRNELGGNSLSPDQSPRHGTLLRTDLGWGSLGSDAPLRRSLRRTRQHRRHAEFCAALARRDDSPSSPVRGSGGQSGARSSSPRRECNLRPLKVRRSCYSAPISAGAPCAWRAAWRSPRASFRAGCGGQAGRWHPAAATAAPRHRPRLAGRPSAGDMRPPFVPSSGRRHSPRRARPACHRACGGRLAWMRLRR